MRAEAREAPRANAAAPPRLSQTGAVARRDELPAVRGEVWPLPPPRVAGALGHVAPVPDQLRVVYLVVVQLLDGPRRHAALGPGGGRVQGVRRDVPLVPGHVRRALRRARRQGGLQHREPRGPRGELAAGVHAADLAAVERRVLDAREARDGVVHDVGRPERPAEDRGPVHPLAHGGAVLGPPVRRAARLEPPRGEGAVPGLHAPGRHVVLRPGALHVRPVVLGALRRRPHREAATRVVASSARRFPVGAAPAAPQVAAAARSLRGNLAAAAGGGASD
eukprot:CAMPEP_0179253860 /NCGR_PEP_ID=MMETSP0797-20121207/22949_1 /TAXON_ID=47934 /ORGANISM="Dinophysis acuminata, Strain DAEP01" /LENGTH=277 /DNA_ID=CAMNT_0020961737 /DNA_START=119 /DNA_END=951 /DNA_ORIENTATION=-